MPRVKSQNETHQLNVWVPAVILVKVRVLLTDPLTGRVAYGAISQLVTKLLSTWLTEQGATLETENKGKGQ